MPKELKDAFDNLIESIQNSQEYQEYLELEKQVAEHDEINKKIQEVKTLQKKMVKLEYQGLPISEIEKQYQEKIEELEKNPLYKTFIEKQKEVNETLQSIKSQIEAVLDKITG